LINQIRYHPTARDHRVLGWQHSILGWTMKKSGPVTSVWRPAPGLVYLPELVLAWLLFLAHFAWEMLQTPFFSGMAARPHWIATLICLRATLGDVAIGLISVAAVALWQRDRWWFLSPSHAAIAVYLAAGLMATVALERHAVVSAHRWSYSELMPIVPGLGVGALPVLQWLLLPWPILYLLRRHYLGSDRRRDDRQS